MSLECSSSKAIRDDFVEIKFAEANSACRFKSISGQELIDDELISSNGCNKQIVGAGAIDFL